MADKSIETIVKELITSKNNSRDLCEELFIDKSNYSLSKIKAVLEKPFNILKEKYIDPILYHKGEYHFRYDEKLDEFNNQFENYTHPLDYDNYREEVTQRWILRKKEEVKEILSEFDTIVKTSKKNTLLRKSYKTYCFNYVDNSKEDFEKLFIGLKELKILDQSLDFEIFKLSFSGEKLTKQPKILFNATKQVLWYFLTTLMDLGAIDNNTNYSAINKNLVVFVDANGEEFSELKSDASKYKRYKKEGLHEFRSSTIIKKLDDLMVDILG
jgi:hypothetical protein